MTKSEIRDRIKGGFSFILLHCPNFPAQCTTTIEKEFTELLDLLNAASDYCKGDSTKLIRIAVKETKQSQTAYEKGAFFDAAMIIQHAEKHFDQAFSKKRIVTRFIVGESGAAADTATGFPA